MFALANNGDEDESEMRFTRYAMPVDEGVYEEQARSVLQGDTGTMAIVACAAQEQMLFW